MMDFHAERNWITDITLKIEGDEYTLSEEEANALIRTLAEAVESLQGMRDIVLKDD